MAPLEPLPGVPLTTMRARKLESTQRLLGATITISDEDWQKPTRLPGWTRAHIGTHIARNADGLRRLVGAALGGAAEPLYPSSHADDLERGSERSALDLQIDLDTSAGRLNDLFDSLTDEQWALTVEPRPGEVMPLAWLPLARLSEVEIHHVDLEAGYTIDDIDPEIAGWLVAWYARRLSAASATPWRLRATDGLAAQVGDGSGPEVTGSRHALLGWITGRGSLEEVIGGDQAPEPL